MVKVYLFSKEGIKEDVPLEEWQSQMKEASCLLWADVRSAKRDELDHLAQLFNLHPVAIESCLDRYRRPHLYEFSDHFYINLTVIKKGGANGYRGAELHLFAGANWLITVSRDPASNAVQEALNDYLQNPSICDRGPMYAVYLITEDLVETYYPIIESLDDSADRLEDEMIEKADKELMKELFLLKRHGYELRKLLGPQRDILNELSRRDFPFIEGENKIYFQDTYNRMIRIFDMLDTVREILSGTMDIYLSSVSNRLNEIVKVLTIAATILMTLALITGFYGMNFTHLPWLTSPNAFRNMLLLMLVITAGMLWWFKRKDWL